MDVDFDVDIDIVLCQMSLEGEGDTETKNATYVVPAEGDSEDLDSTPEVAGPRVTRGKLSLKDKPKFSMYMEDKKAKKRFAPPVAHWI